MNAEAQATVSFQVANRAATHLGRKLYSTTPPGLCEVSRGRRGREGRRYDGPPFANAKRCRRGPRGARQGVTGGAAGRGRNERPLFENALSKAASLAKVT